MFRRKAVLRTEQPFATECGRVLCRNGHDFRAFCTDVRQIVRDRGLRVCVAGIHMDYDEMD